MLAPQMATAQMESSSMWWSRASGQCQDSSLAEYSPVVVAEPAPCPGLGDSDPAHNVCFEGNPAQASILPDMLARWQAELVAAKMFQIVSKVHASLLDENAKDSSAERWAHEPPRSLFFSALDTMPRSPEPALVCYASTDHCRSLPPLPVPLSLASLTPASSSSTQTPSFPPRLFDGPPEAAAWARLALGPSSEHRLVPEQPPPRLG